MTDKEKLHHLKHSAMGCGPIETCILCNNPPAFLGGFGDASIPTAEVSSSLPVSTAPAGSTAEPMMTAPAPLVTQTQLYTTVILGVVSAIVGGITTQLIINRWLFRDDDKRRK